MPKSMSKLTRAFIKKQKKLHEMKKEEKKLHGFSYTWNNTTNFACKPLISEEWATYIVSKAKR